MNSILYGSHFLAILFLHFSLMPPVDSSFSPDAMNMMAMQSQAQVSPIFMVVWLAIYVFYSYCLFILAKKLGEQYAWMAWVPVLNIVLQMRMAKMSLWWILGLFVPFFNIYVVIRMLHDGVSKRTGHGGWWTVGLIFLGFIFMPLTAFGYKGENTAPTV